MQHVWCGSAHWPRHVVCNSHVTVNWLVVMRLTGRFAGASQDDVHTIAFVAVLTLQDGDEGNTLIAETQRQLNLSAREAMLLQQLAKDCKLGTSEQTIHTLPHLRPQLVSITFCA